MTSNRLRIGILGASGYTGAELVRMLSEHPSAELVVLTADSHAGEAYHQVYPHLGHLGLPDLVRVDEVDWRGLDLDTVFCGLPHGTTQKIVADVLGDPTNGPRKSPKIIDLSADFRIEDPAVYAEWYGHEHFAPALQPEAVYGLTERVRPALGDARLVACPGCYPTGAILPLAPLLADDLIDADDIIIDAKSGITGAGRAAKQAHLYGEVAEGIHAYGIAGHRHGPEMEQELSKIAGRPLTVSFTPHLVPMNRGILSTIYVRLRAGAAVADLRRAIEAAYANEPFARLAPDGLAPASRHVRGSNLCLMAAFADRLPGRAILISALDNLVKGASGQAIQNMNVMHGLDETAGLRQAPLFP